MSPQWDLRLWHRSGMPRRPGMQRHQFLRVHAAFLLKRVLRCQRLSAARRFQLRQRWRCLRGLQNLHHRCVLRVRNLSVRFTRRRVYARTTLRQRTVRLRLTVLRQRLLHLHGNLRLPQPDRLRASRHRSHLSAVRSAARGQLRRRALQLRQFRRLPAEPGMRRRGMSLRVGGDARRPARFRS